MLPSFSVGFQCRRSWLHFFVEAVSLSVQAVPAKSPEVLRTPRVEMNFFAARQPLVSDPPNHLVLPAKHPVWYELLLPGYAAPHHGSFLKLEPAHWQRAMKVFYQAFV